jgi:hypothetical protein
VTMPITRADEHPVHRGVGLNPYDFRRALRWRPRPIGPIDRRFPD